MTISVSPLRLVRWIAWVAVGLLTAAMLYLMMAPEARKGAVIGGPFTLTAMTGQRVNVGEAEKGKPYAVFFGFTHCPDICPTSMYELSQLLAKLGDRARDFRVYFVSVDPERDTPKIVNDYVSSFDKRIIGLSGPRAEIDKVIKAYRVYAKKIPDAKGGEDYAMDHTAIVYLMDKRGRFIGAFNMSRPPAEAAKDLAKYL